MKHENERQKAKDANEDDRFEGQQRIAKAKPEAKDVIPSQKVIMA